jgi:hypothetical protein
MHDVAIEDRSNVPPNAIRYPYDPSLLLPHGNGINREKHLPLLLDNLARQAGLQFRVERQTAPIWFVVEDKNS